MIQVELDNILTEEDALSGVKEIFTDVEQTGETYVITKDGKPAFAIVSVDKLEQPLETKATPAPAPETFEATHEEDAEPASPMNPVPAQPEPTMTTPEPVSSTAMPAPAPMSTPTPPPLPTMPTSAELETPMPNTTNDGSIQPNQPLPPMSELPQQSTEVSSAPASTTPTETPAPSQPAAAAPAAQPTGDTLPDMPEDPTNSSPLA